MAGENCRLLVVFIISVLFLASTATHGIVVENMFIGHKPPLIQSGIVLDGDPGDWPQLKPLHPAVRLDGGIDDWYTGANPIPWNRVTRDNAVTDLSNPNRLLYVWDYGNGNKYTYYRGEFIWFDALGDQRSGYTGRLDADISEIRVTSNNTHLLVLFRVVDLGVLGGGAVSPSIGIILALDTDMNYHNGNTTLLDDKTSVPNYAPWDYEVLIDLSNPAVANKKVIYGDGIPVGSGGSPLDIYNATGAEVSTSMDAFIADSANDCVEVALSWRDIGVLNPWNVSNVRLYAGVFISDGYGKPLVSLNNSDFIDVLSAKSSDDELSDGVLDSWIDIGFNRLPEPVYFTHEVLDDKGYIQYWSDLTNDTRTDYIPNEAFDTDILTETIWINSSRLNILLHIKGNVRPTGNATPFIILAIDSTPLNESDGGGPLITAPPGKGATDTYLGGRLGREANYTSLIWIDPLQDQVTVVVPGATVNYDVYTGPNYIAYDYHFIEVSIPTTDLGELKPPFRVETAVYALANPGSPLVSSSPSIQPNQIIDLTGANAYDTLSPYPTYGTGVDNGYAVNGEFYGDVDEYIDTFIPVKIATRLINPVIQWVSYDNDTYIEIGEPASAYATLQYWNGTGWSPLSGGNVTFYLVGSLIYLGWRLTDSNGTAYMDLDDIARNASISSGTYRLMVRYEPPLEYVKGLTGTEFFYSSAENTSIGNYTILNKPFIESLPEPQMLPLTLLLAMVVFTLLRRHYSGSHG